jgi:hypothetical protein
MRFVPIPTPLISQPIKETEVWKTREAWLPFMPRIADRSDETVDELIDHVISGRVHIGVVLDVEKREPRALIGMIISNEGREKIGQVRWATGFGTKDWQHLLPELETYLKEKVGCTIIKPYCRPGWKPFLKKHGYKQTHVIMEKPL